MLLPGGRGRDGTQEVRTGVFTPPARTGLREVHALACEEFAEWVKETWGRSGERESRLLK